jgi:outer membrane lipoprotein-sorting protein
VPSASRRYARLAVLALCGLLPLGAASGCSTTQEKADIQQARAKHILDARAERQRQRKHGKSKQDQRGNEKR